MEEFYNYYLDEFFYQSNHTQKTIPKLPTYLSDTKPVVKLISVEYLLNLNFVYTLLFIIFFKLTKIISNY